MLIDATGLDGLDLSLRPPKWLRKGAANVGRAVLKAAPIISTAAMLVPGVGTAIGAAGKAILGASRVLPGAATAINVGSKAAAAAKALQASRVVRTAIAVRGVTSLVPKRPTPPQPISPPPSLEPMSEDPAGAILPGRRRTFPIGRNNRPPSVVPIGGRAPVDPFSNPILLPPPPGPVTDGPRIKPPATPGPIGVPVDPGSNPISLVPDERIQQLRDAAARVVGGPNAGAPPASSGPSAQLPFDQYPSSSGGGGAAMTTAATESAPQAAFPWVTVIAIGGGLWLLTRKGSKR